MEQLIVKPLKESNISTVIVIDGLDECKDEEPASIILSVLGRLVAEIPKVKFFLTGRPEPRISKGFRLPLLAEIKDIFFLHGVEKDKVNSDIRLFFKEELTGHPTEAQLDQLCERADGLFVYAEATVQFINDPKKNPEERLSLLLDSQKIGGREGKFTLDSLYTSILEEAFGNDPEDDTKNCSVLGAVILAINPLSPSTIAKLLELKVEWEVLPLLSSVNSLLVLQEDANHPVQPFHKSFPDFITDPTRCTNQRFYLSPPCHHLELLVGCLKLMNQKLEKNMCQLPDAVANSDVGDLKARVDKYIDPALQYACVSWHTHLLGVEITPADAPTITSTLDEFLNEFLNAKFLFWLEVLSVLCTVKNAVHALRAAMDLLKVC